MNCNLLVPSDIQFCINEYHILQLTEEIANLLEYQIGNYTTLPNLCLREKPDL